MDISPGMIKTGREYYKDENSIKWIVGDVHACPVKTSSMNAVIALGMLFNYLDDPILFLNETHRILVNKGVLILEITNSDHPAEYKSVSQLKDGRLRNLYNLRSIEQMLKESRFEVVECIGVRYLVDMLPQKWNKPDNNDKTGREILLRLLQEEKLLSTLMPVNKAKQILLAAVK
jgi:SAM-dependent methyltransferase